MRLQPCTARGAPLWVSLSCPWGWRAAPRPGSPTGRCPSHRSAGGCQGRGTSSGCTCPGADTLVPALCPLPPVPIRFLTLLSSTVRPVAAQRTGTSPSKPHPHPDFVIPVIPWAAGPGLSSSDLHWPLGPGLLSSQTNSTPRGKKKSAHKRRCFIMRFKAAPLSIRYRAERVRG